MLVTHQISFADASRCFSTADGRRRLKNLARVTKLQVEERRLLGCTNLTLVTFLTLSLHIQIANIQRVILNKLAAGLDDVAHQDCEHFVGVDGVVVV